MTDIARRRLASQHLVSPTLTSAVDVVRLLGAVQAQDYPNAKWAVARRTPALRDADVEQAYASGAILRTHVLRPTWHFILPEDARWMLALTAPRLTRAMGSYNRTLGLDAKQFGRANDAIARALEGDAQLTRAELATVLQRARVKAPTGQHVGHLLMQAELDQVVISGARRGKQVTYALFDDRVPRAPARDRDDMLRELALRYFATRGPATLHDFAWWSGLTVGDARRAMEANGKSLERETIGDRAYWRVPSAGDGRRVRRIAHILPNYDELFVGFRDRSAFGTRIRLRDKNARIDALMGHILFVDGQIVGGWQRTVGKYVDLEVRLLATLTAAERKLVEREAKRFGEFLGTPVRMCSARRAPSASPRGLLFGPDTER